MGLYNMRSLNILSSAILATDSILTEVLNMIDEKQYTDARMRWLLYARSALYESGEMTTNGNICDLEGDPHNYTKQCPIFW